MTVQVFFAAVTAVLVLDRPTHTGGRGAYIEEAVQQPKPPSSPSPSPPTSSSASNHGCDCMDSWDFKGETYHGCDERAPDSKRPWCVLKEDFLADSKARCGFAMLGNSVAKTTVAHPRWDFCNDPAGHLHGSHSPAASDIHSESGGPEVWHGDRAWEELPEAALVVGIIVGAVAAARYRRGRQSPAPQQAEPELL